MNTPRPGYYCISDLKARLIGSSREKKGKNTVELYRKINKHLSTYVPYSMWAMNSVAYFTLEKSARDQRWYKFSGYRCSSARFIIEQLNPLRQTSS